RSGTAVPVSPWAQLILIAAAFCLGRESLPSRFAGGDLMERPQAPARQTPRPPVREAPQRRQEIASAGPATIPSARPPRPRVRVRTGPPPNRAPPETDQVAEEENRPSPVLSRVFFGIDPSDGTLPQKISGPDPTYTGPALEHEVEGVMRVV